MPHRDPHSNQEGEVLQDVERAAYATHAAHEWHVAETIYSEEEVAWLPNGAVTSALGLDHPVRAAQLRSGETVLDLGCGGGIDTLLAARAVGPTGQAIGLDMTHEMIVLAQANAAALGLTNTRFLEGDMTALPPTFENDSGLLITPAVLIHPDSLHVMSEVLQEVGEGRESLKRATCLRKDGTSFLIESHVTPFTYKGQPHLLSVTRDITEQAEAEAQLREREEQYRSVFEATHDGLVIFDLDGFIVEANPAYCSLFSYTHDELIGLHASVLFPPDRHSYMAGNLKTLKAGSDFQTRVGRGLRKDGTLFYQESHGTPLTYRGKPYGLGVLRDVTEQVQAQQLLEQRVEERTRELSTLLEVSHNVASTLELKSLLGLILEQLKVVADYTGSSILIVEGEDLVIFENRGPYPVERVLHLHFPVKPFGVIWEMLCRQETVIIDDVRDDSAPAETLRLAVGDILNTTFRHVRTWMGIPLALKEQIIGVLILTSREPSYFTSRHAALALGIANQAAIAIENARLYSQAQGLAALEERQKLARELHDSVSQALYGISLGAHAARTALERDPDHVAEPLDYVLSLAEAGLAEMRALIFELRPESLETEGLVSAGEQVIQR